VEREELVVVGGGVAGASAAIEAAGRGLRVTLVDEHPIDLATMALDTPYFFGPRLLPTLGDRGLMLDRIAGSSEWISRADEAGVTVLLGTCAWGSFRPGENSRQLDAGCLGLADGERSWMLEYERLILAPGARDLVLSFPGWELPGVLGASAAAALLERYQALAGRRMVVLGSGALGLRTAWLALERGLQVAGIVEVSPEVRGPAELAARLAARGVPFFTGHAVAAVAGSAEVSAIRLVRVDGGLEPVAGSETEIACDTVCLALGLVPNVELAYLTGCRLQYRADRGGWVPDRGAGQETSVDGVHVAGDGGGVGEAEIAATDLAAAEGRQAGAAAAQARTGGRGGAVPAGAGDGARAPGPAGIDRDAWLQALVATGGMDVVVCQCEEVTRRELLEVKPPRYLGTPPRPWETKLSTVQAAGPAHPDLLKRLTRAGMGHCQGRRCREQVTMLLARAAGVDPGAVPLASYRPPVRPLPMRVLWPEDEPEALRQKWASWFHPWLKVHG
jgi:NADPH-dependent 2,4-dienoyl-CoA reductase/sulfur reductase-like enzyme